MDLFKLLFEPPYAVPNANSTLQGVEMHWWGAPSPLTEPKEEPEMKKSEALAAALVAELEREARIVERYGEEGPDGTVVSFRRRFPNSLTRYRYAAIRANGLWYITGPNSPKGYTWEEFTTWLEEAETTKFRVLK